MPATQLQFYQVGSYPYPYATTGAGSALTVCRRDNDPYLAFLTQTSYEDEIVFLYLHLSVSQESGRLQTPPGHDVISGMDYAIFRNIIWAVQSTQNQDTIIGIDPDKVKAEFKKGVLKVTIFKRADELSKQIPINT